MPQRVDRNRTRASSSFNFGVVDVAKPPAFVCFVIRILDYAEELVVIFVTVEEADSAFP